MKTVIEPTSVEGVFLTALGELAAAKIEYREAQAAQDTEAATTAASAIVVARTKLRVFGGAL